MASSSWGWEYPKGEDSREAVSKPNSRVWAKCVSAHGVSLFGIWSWAPAQFVSVSMETLNTALLSGIFLLKAGG